jgi:hypothetical protein
MDWGKRIVEIIGSLGNLVWASLLQNRGHIHHSVEDVGALCEGGYERKSRDMREERERREGKSMEFYLVAPISLVPLVLRHRPYGPDPRHAPQIGGWHRFISSICSPIFRSYGYIQRQELLGYCAKLLRRLACCANLIALRPVEKVDQIILRSAPQEYSVNRGNVTVILVGEFRVVVHADRVPVSQEYLTDQILNLCSSLFSLFFHA